MVEDRPASPRVSIEKYVGWLLLAILIFAASIRFLRLTEGTLWLDETASAWFSAQSWSYLWNELPSHETNPPHYYMMLKAWRGFAGWSEIALRIPSAIASVGVVYFLCVAGRVVGGAQRGWALGLMAALICAAWQFQIGHAANARGYAFSSLGIAILMTGCLQLVGYSRDSEKAAPYLFGSGGRNTLAFVAIAVGSVLALSSHMLAVVPVGLMSIFLFVWWSIRHRCDGRLFWSLAATAAAIVLLYAPYLPSFLALATGERGDLSGISFLEKPSFRWLVGLSSKAFGQHSFELGDVQVLIDAILIAVGAVGFWRVTTTLRKDQGWVIGFMASLIGGVWLLLVMITYLVQPVLMPRSLIFAQPPLILVLAAASWAITRGRALLTTTILLFILVGVLQPLEVILPGKRTYDAMVDKIAQSDAPDAPVIIVPYLLETGLLYYEEERGVVLNRRPYPLPFRLPNQPIPRIDGDIASEIVAALDEVPTVWVLVRRLDEIDPDFNLYRQLEAAGYQRSIVVRGEVLDWHETLSRFDHTGSS